MNPGGWESLSDQLADLLLYAAWALMAGLIAMGACCYGGLAAYQAWLETGPPSRSRHQRARIGQEAARGITEIEAFLAARVTQPPSESRPDA